MVGKPLRPRSVPAGKKKHFISISQYIILSFERSYRINFIYYQVNVTQESVTQYSSNLSNLLRSSSDIDTGGLLALAKSLENIRAVDAPSREVRFSIIFSETLNK